jgi:hypothetical protein
MKRGVEEALRRVRLDGPARVCRRMYGPPNDRLSLDRVAFIGRTFGEYLDMFALDHDVLSRGPVLDCPAGPSSFAAEATERGFDATACDVLYGESAGRLGARCERDIGYIYAKLDEAPHLYTWRYYRDKAEVVSLRRKAFGKFLLDFQEGRKRGRYVEAALPRLPFPDGRFSLVLSGHFLFLYGDRLDFDFHLACLRELLRVSSGEVRVFPLQGLDAKPYAHLGEITDALKSEGIYAETARVALEFQRGGNMMLRLGR